MIPFAEINRAALAQLPALLREWFPAGQTRGREFVVGDLSGACGESLSVNTQTGHWADFAGDARGGDPVSLFAAIRRIDQGNAARELGTRLGVYMNGHAGSDAPAPQADHEWRPLLPPPPTASAPDLTGYDVIHTYRDSAGNPLFYVRRREARGDRRKQFVPLTYGYLGGKLSWHAKHPLAPRPLYGLDRLAARPDARVIVCEGEKAADAAQRLLPEWAAVSWAGGSNSVGSAEWSALADREVIIWPDNDAPGAKAAADVRRALVGIAVSIAMLRVDDIGEGADAADVRPDDPVAWIAERLISDNRAETDEPPEDEVGYWESLVDSADEPKRTAARRRAVSIDPIKIEAGQIDITADLAEAALLASGLPVFQRGQSLVRPIKQDVPSARGGTTTAAGLAAISSSGLVDLLSQAVEWQRYDARRKRWAVCDPPAQLASIVLSRAGEWRAPSIAGVITTPTVRPDGSLLHQPGYDAATRLFHVADRSLTLAPSIHAPTRKDAERALANLTGLLSGFPFATELDKSVALSAILTGVARGAVSVAPMHAFRAYAAGTGKSYLADLMSYIATGRACPVMAAAAKEEETEKRLIGLLLAAVPIVSIDNVNGELGGDLLCQAVERPLVRVRALGSSDITEIESRATIIATGNNFRVRGDMARRTLICTLDAKMERPELRAFAFDPVEEVLRNRGLYVSACLTIVRAFRLSGAAVELPPIASFGEWSALIRGALVWLGCEDPAASMEVARDDDPELAELREMAALWKQHVGLNVAMTCKQVDAWTAAQKTDDFGHSTGELVAPEFRDALIRVAGNRGEISTKSLGRWLMARQGRVVSGLRFEKSHEDRKGTALWALVVQ